ncbi:MAG: acyl-CoA dehydrogenase family protein [Burkholderiaceae bacterium]|nr:acyl-CoA dehydrogenase family protein [Burkholderiaceae bacterium]
MPMGAAPYKTWFEGVRRLVWDTLSSYVEQIERTEQAPVRELIPLFARHRLWGCLVPEEYGGLGLTVAQYVPVLIELSKLHAGLRGFLHAHNATSVLLKWGTPEQKRRWLPGVAAGEIQLAFALTEPNAGTGVDIKTAARRDGDVYLLNGQKHLISNCDVADYIAVVCYTDRSKGRDGISVLLLPKDAPGFHWRPNRPTMGCKGFTHGWLTFDDCRVPAANLVGGVEGRGIEHALTSLEESRVFIASTSLGTAERAFELSLAHAKKRVTFGKAIAEREGVRAYLAEMAIDIYALRNMLADAIDKLDRGLPIPAEAAMCKLFGAEAVCRVTDRALLVHGGIGYTSATPIEQLYRDARINLIEEGTPTIQKTVIARSFLDGGALGAYPWERA